MEIQGNGKQAKRSDVGFASIVLLISQIINSQQSTSEIKQEIAKLRDDLQIVQIDIKNNFVQKSEIQALNNHISIKLNRVNSQLKQIKKDIKDIRELYVVFEDEPVCKYDYAPNLSMGEI